MKRKTQWGAVAIATMLVAALVATTVGTAGAGVKAAGTTRGITKNSITVGALVSEQVFGGVREGRGGPVRP